MYMFHCCRQHGVEASLVIASVGLSRCINVDKHMCPPNLILCHYRLPGNTYIYIHDGNTYIWWLWLWCQWLEEGSILIDSLWRSDAIWGHRTGSTLAQVMAWCLMAPSHYLNQCWCIISRVLHHSLNSSPPRQNRRQFGRRLSKMHFLEWKFCILIKISLKSVSKGPIDNNPTLVQIVAWCQIGDKPLSEPILT